MNSIKSKKVIPKPLGNKENNKKLQSEGSTCAGVRSALSDVENILSQKKSLDVRTARAVQTITIASQKFRSSSATEVETNVKYFFKSENVTERKKGSEITKHLDEVFVKSNEHYINYLPKSNSADCIPNTLKLKDDERRITKPLPVVRVYKAKEETSKPAQKANLVRKLSNRRKRFRLEEAFENCMYDEIYFEDNYQYMAEMEKKFVYRKSILKSCIDENHRMIVINWLIYIQQVLNLAENTFFMAIRIFDYALVTLKVPSNKYVLMGIACVWITNKLVDVHFIQAPKLFALCNGKFSKKEILSIEKEILNAVKFQVNVPEPTSFLFYYLKREGLHINPRVVYSAMFLLESFSLVLDFSSLAPSVLASLALFLVLNKYTTNASIFLEHIKLLETDTFIRKANMMKRTVEELLRVKSVSKEVIEKYSTEEKYFVAKDFETH